MGAFLAKPIFRKSVVLGLILAFSLIWNVPAAFAAPDDPVPDAATAGDQSRKPTPPSIQESFNVNTYLKTDKQTSLVPSAGTSTAASSAQSGVIGFLVKAIDLFVRLIASIALIVFIIGALLTVTSEGKEDRLEKGKSAMFYAIIGLVIALFSFVMVTFVQSVLF